jgi:hypothetical protein
MEHIQIKKYVPRVLRDTNITVTGFKCTTLGLK